MSDDSYTIEGVTITTLGGGHYELKHPSLAEPVKERGKEDAEKRAKQIAAEALETQQQNDGSIPQQGALPPAGTGQAEPPQDAGATAGDKPADTDATVKAKDDEIAALRAALAQSEDEKQKLLDAAGNTVTTVEQIGESEQPEGVMPKGVAIPHKYAGKLDDAAKKALKKAGIETVKIVLEESADIPPTGLFLGHNGKGYVIVPGEEVEVPEFLLGVLDSAVMAAPIVNRENNMKVVGYRNRMRYPYRRV